jgi:uncharacterized OB-fold protein
MVDIDSTPVLGPIGPRRDQLDAPYWEGLAAGELRMQRCTKCHRWWWAPVWRCSECGSWDLGWEAVPARGRVYSWVRSQQAFSQAMKTIVPFVTLLVEIPDADWRRLFGILVGPEDGLDIGVTVEGIIQPPSPLTHGQAVLRWKLVGP